MQPFWETVVSNALMVVVLAAGVALLARVWRNAFCLHVLWVLVLLKLVTPPVVTVPLPSWARRPLPASEQHTASLDLASPSPVESLRLEPAIAAAGSENRDLPAVESQIAVTVGRIGNPSYNAPDPVHGPDIDNPSAASRGAAESSELVPSSSTVENQEMPWRIVLGWVWGAGIVLFASAHGFRIVRFRRLLRSSKTPSSAVLSIAKEIAGRLRLSRVPEIRALPVRVSPMVWSLGGRPRVFLPESLFERLDGIAQEAILAHELAHVRRKDHWVRLLELAITTLFWWHPVVWWAARQLQELEDQCCDGIVVEMAPHGVKSYATALLDTLDFLSERSVAAPLGATAAKSSISLTRRIAMLKNHPSTARMSFGRLMLLLAVSALPMALAFGQKPPEPASKTPPVDGPTRPKEVRGVHRRAIDKLVKDFPEKTDLSTPESALAAACRTLARKDIQGLLELSWVKPWDARTAKDMEDALTHDPHAPKNLEQHMPGTKIIEVLTYRDDCAAVICKADETVLGKGAGPYIAAVLGRIDGTWKCLDEIPPSSSAEEVVEKFEKNKDDVWRHFVEVRKELKNGRTPTHRSAFFAAPGRSEQPVVRHVEHRPPPSLSAAEMADIKQWQGETWRIGVDLDMPSLQPQAVPFAILDEDPVPAFTAHVERMRKHSRQQLDKADNEARKEQVGTIQMAVGWDLGFKKVTGDRLYLLAKRPGYSNTTISSNSPGGKKWIVTKTVQIDGKPLCWCIPVEVAKGKTIDVTFDKNNTFDLRTVYDNAMKEREGVADRAPPAPARKAETPTTTQFPYLIIPHAVKFEQGAKRFSKGDNITILEVRGTAATFAPGNIYWIKGTYTLASRDRAKLAAYTTAKDAANATSTPFAAQSTVVAKGSGTFTLFLPMPCRGWPHVGFYPADGGEGFGGNYFGTGESVRKQWWGAEKTDRVK